MKRINHAVIMAAGRGMRMMPLTKILPKPMAPFLDTTLIGQGIKTIRKGIEHVHITVGYKGAILAKHVVEIGVSSIHNTDGKGNSWWLYNSLLKNLDEPTYVLTCDNVIQLDFNKLEKEYYKCGCPPCMVVPVKPINGLEGDYIFHESHIVTNISREAPSDIYCSGIQILNPKEINQLTNPSESFYDVWRQLINIKRLYCSSIYPDQWYAVDTLKQLEDLEDIYGELSV
jgi:NDP-sugar pyrophosphorylase family protein